MAYFLSKLFMIFFVACLYSELEETIHAMQQVASEKEQLSHASESYLEGLKVKA